MRVPNRLASSRRDLESRLFVSSLRSQSTVSRWLTFSSTTLQCQITIAPVGEIKKHLLAIEKLTNKVDFASSKGMATTQSGVDKARKSVPSLFEPYEGLSEQTRKELEKLQDRAIAGAKRAREGDLS